MALRVPLPPLSAAIYGQIQGMDTMETECQRWSGSQQNVRVSSDREETNVGTSGVNTPTRAAVLTGGSILSLKKCALKCCDAVC